MDLFDTPESTGGIGLGARAAAVEEFHVLDRVILYSPESNKALPLQGTCLTVWELYGKRRSLSHVTGEVIRQRAAETPESRFQAAVDVRSAAQQLCNLGFLRLEHELPSNGPEWYAVDNGFSSPATMDAAHRPVVEIVLALLAGKGGKVLDLGCGNGALLRKIHEGNAAVVPYGIETDSERLSHAEHLLPQFAGNFICGDMFQGNRLWSSGEQYEVAILAPLRLLEASRDRGDWIRERLRESARLVVMHAYYRDGLTLRERAERCGLPLACCLESEAAEVGISVTGIDILNRAF